MQKSFTYKVYDKTGATLLKTWQSNVVVSLPSFSMQLYGGYSESVIRLNLPFDNYDEGTSIEYGNIVYIYEIDENNLNGRMIYSGFISNYSPFYNADGSEGVELSLLGFVSMLTRKEYKNGASYDVTETSVSPEDMIKNIVDQANSVLPGTPFSYAGTVDTSGVTATYTFSDKKWLDAISEAFDFFGGGWYWFFGLDGQVYIKENPSTATHTFTLKKDIHSIKAKKSGEKLINEAFVTYSSGVQTFSDATSISEYGTHSIHVTDTNITDSATALQKAKSLVNDSKDLKIAITMRINSAYDIESIKPGDTCKIRNHNINNTTFTDNMQIKRVSYNPNYVDLEIEELQSFAHEFRVAQ